MNAVEVRDLRKSYGTNEAVRGVSFDIVAGEVYALLGHNGAGKSTIVEIMEGYRKRTSGEVTVLGSDPARAGRGYRDRIGIVLQTSGIEHELTVREVIDLYGSAYRRQRPTAETIGLVGLDEKADTRVGTLSGGQRRRLDLALGIVGYPEVLFLDEPTTGFDAAARRKSWELIAELCRLGTTVLLTTHYLDEAEHLADRVGVIAHGKLVAEGTPAELVGNKGATVVSFSLAGAEPAAIAGALPAGATVRGSQIEFVTDDATHDVHAVTSWALANAARLDNLSVARPSLEDVFLDLAGDDTSTDLGEDEDVA